VEDLCLYKNVRKFVINFFVSTLLSKITFFSSASLKKTIFVASYAGSDLLWASDVETVKLPLDYTAGEGTCAGIHVNVSTPVHHWIIAYPWSYHLPFICEARPTFEVRKNRLRFNFTPLEFRKASKKPLRIFLEIPIL